jgi:hypothetical protein
MHISRLFTSRLSCPTHPSLSSEISHEEDRAKLLLTRRRFLFLVGAAAGIGAALPKPQWASGGIIGPLDPPYIVGDTPTCLHPGESIITPLQAASVAYVYNFYDLRGSVKLLYPGYAILRRTNHPGKAGEYSLDDKTGVFTFHQDDAGREVNISHVANKKLLKKKLAKPVFAG